MLTFPARVTEHNIDMLRQAVRNGLDIHPGANLVVFKVEERKVFLKVSSALREKFATKLQIGDIVERHLVDNEYVPSSVSKLYRAWAERCAVSCSSIDNPVCTRCARLLRLRDASIA